MAGKQRFYRDRIRSTQALKKIFRAMELMAASRISKARASVSAAGPYARAITQAVTADRGMAGAYSASVLREGERLITQLLDGGGEVDLYVTGRRAVSYYTFRNRPLAGRWTGSSDSPTTEVSREIAATLLRSFLAEPDEGGVGQLYVVYTHFVNMVTQTPRVIRMLPLEVVEAASPDGAAQEPIPLYEFEPSAEVVLDALLPQYVRSRIHNFLLQAAASELAARQRAASSDAADE